MGTDVQENNTANLPQLVGGPNNDLKHVSRLLNSAEERIAEVASRYVRPERIIKVGLLAVSRQPLLMECTFESFLLAMMESAQAGLEPTGFGGEAYLIPRKNTDLTNRVRNATGKRSLVVREANFQPGYRGLVKVMTRDPNIGNVESRAVYEGDGFDFDLGLDPKLHHKPVPPSQRQATDDEARGLIAVYAVTRFRDPEMRDHFEIMWREDVERVRAASENPRGNHSPWTNWYEQMARKSVIRREAKLVPVDTETAAIMEYDELVEMGHRASLGQLSPAFRNLIEGQAEPEAPSQTDKVREKVALRRGQEVGQDPTQPPAEEEAPKPKRDNSDVAEETLKLRGEYRKALNAALTEPVPDDIIAEWEREVAGATFTEMTDFQLQTAMEALDQNNIPGGRVPGQEG